MTPSGGLERRQRRPPHLCGIEASGRGRWEVERLPTSSQMGTRPKELVERLTDMSGPTRERRWQQLHIVAGGRVRWEEVAAHKHEAAAARPKPKPKPRPVRQILSLLLPSLRSFFTTVVPFLPHILVICFRAAEAEGAGARRPQAVRRVASLPEQPNYVEGAELRDSMYDAYAASSKAPTGEEKAGAVAKAEELRRRIHHIRRPAFVKTVNHICASRAKPMPIPKHFIQYLPAGDEAVVVVDEADAEFYMMYNASKQGRHPYLAKGWREFVLHHDLANGNCLVIQLKERATFKVYIFRASPDYERDETSDDYEDED